MFSKFYCSFFKQKNLMVSRNIRYNCQKSWKIEPASLCDRKEILNFVEKNFLKDEPLAKALIPGENPPVFKKIVRESFDQGLSVVAKRTCGDFEIIGACINSRSFIMTATRYLKWAQGVDDQHLKKLLQTMAMVESDSNVNEKLNQDEIFLLSVLIVSDKQWGKGIGLEMVRKSLELAREKQFKFAKMNCMNENTLNIAEQLQMKRLWCLPYKSLLCRGKIRPCAFPEAPHLSAYVYYIDVTKNWNLTEKCE